MSPGGPSIFAEARDRPRASLVKKKKKSKTANGEAEELKCLHTLTPRTCGTPKSHKPIGVHLC